MIPEKIRPFFEVSCRKNKDGNELIKGTLTCCASHDFEVFAEGEIKCGVFSKLYLLPENDRLALNARCKSAAEIFRSLTTAATDMKSAGAGSLHIRREKTLSA